MGQGLHKEQFSDIDSEEAFTKKYANNNNNTSRSPISTLLRKRPSFNRKKKGEDPIMSDQQQYKYMTADGDKLGADDSLKIDVTHDERDHSRDSYAGGVNEYIVNNHHVYNSQHSPNNMSVISSTSDNVDIARTPVHVGRAPWTNFLVSFLVDARGGAMKGCRHSGVRVIIPPRKAPQPMRVTCRYLRKDKLTNPPVIMESEALASRILELGPAGAKFLGPVIIEVPHFASLRNKERELIILRSDDGSTWKEHKLDASEEAVQEVLNESFPGEELRQLEDLHTSRIVRILTVDFPQYFAVVSRLRQEIHAVGPEGGVVSSSAVPLVQALFPPDALTKRIKVGLQAQPIPSELVTKLLGNRVAVSPIVSIEPRRRKFHKPITLTIPLPQAANKGMINQYSGNAPTLRLLCSITGGNSKAVWEDVTGATPLTFVKDCVSFTTTISARFWLVDCSNVSQAPNMASELYNVASHVPFMAKFVVFAKRTDLLEARLRVFCMTDDKEDKTLEHQEHFTEVAKSRDVEVMQGRPIHVEFVGNLIPIAKSGDPLKLEFHAFKENRLPFTVRVRDPDETTMARILFMREPKVARGEPAQSPLCTLNIGLPDNIVPESAMSESDLLNLDISHQLLAGRSFAHTETIQRADIRLSDISNLLAGDWRLLAAELGIADDDVRAIGQEYGDNPRQQALVMLKLWMKTQGPNATGNNLEKGLRSIHREDIVNQCIYNLEIVTDDMERAVAKTRLDQSGFDTLQDELGPSRDSTLNRSPSRKGKKSHFQEDHSDIENEKFLDDTTPSPIPPSPIPHYEHPSPEPNHQDGVARLGDIHPNHITEDTETFQHETQPTDNHTQHVHETTTITSHSNEDPSVVETTTITTTTTKKSKQKPKPKKRTEPKSLVSDFLSQEITNSSHQLVEIPSGENPAKNPSPSPRTYPEDGTGWEKYHKDEGNGNKPWEFDEGEEGFNGNGNKNGDSKLSREQQDLWRSPSLEAEMIINEDVTHETRWSNKRRDSGDDSGSDYEKEMKRSSSGNNNHSQNNGGAKSKIPPSSSGSDVAVREGASDSEEDNTNNGADLTHENSAQNINELVSNKKLHS